MSVKENLEIINQKIFQAEKNSGRSSGSVKLMAVSKFHPQSNVLQALQCGQTLFGENRVQEASIKFPEVFEQYPETELHLIGQLQSNKVKKAVEIADCLESVDRIELLQEIEKQCTKFNKSIKILFEYHTGEDSKSGYTSEDSLFESLEVCKNGLFPHIIPSGFMTMAPFTSDTVLVRKSFAALRKLSEKCRSSFPQFDLSELSMGMSGDFEIAIEEGSTLVRIGTAIFGERDYSR